MHLIRDLDADPDEVQGVLNRSSGTVKQIARAIMRVPAGES